MSSHCASSVTPYDSVSRSASPPSYTPTPAPVFEHFRLFSAALASTGDPGHVSKLMEVALSSYRDALRVYSDAMSSAPTPAAGTTPFFSSFSSSSTARGRGWRAGTSFGVYDKSSRGSSVSSSPVLSDVGPRGKCYVLLSAGGHRSMLKRSLGVWPMFSSLLAEPAVRYDVSRLQSTTLVSAGGSSWHVEPLTSTATSTLVILSHFIAKHACGLNLQSAMWDGTLLQALVCRADYKDILATSPGVVPCFSDVLGGLREKPLTGGSDFMMPSDRILVTDLKSECVADCVKFFSQFSVVTYLCSVFVCTSELSRSDLLAMPSHWFCSGVPSFVVLPVRPGAYVFQGARVYSRDLYADLSRVVELRALSVAYSGIPGDMWVLVGPRSVRSSFCSVSGWGVYSDNDSFSFVDVRGTRPGLALPSPRYNSSFSSYAMRPFSGSELDESSCSCRQEECTCGSRRSSPCLDASAPGFCYLRVIKPASRSMVSAECGSCPSVYRLLAMAFDRFDMFSLAVVGFSTLPLNHCHLSYSSSELFFPHLLAMLFRDANQYRDFLPGSLAVVLLESDLAGRRATSPRLGLDVFTMVGGPSPVARVACVCPDSCSCRHCTPSSPALLEVAAGVAPVEADVVCALASSQLAAARFLVSRVSPTGFVVELSESPPVLGLSYAAYARYDFESGASLVLIPSVRGGPFSFAIPGRVGQSEYEICVRATVCSRCRRIYDKCFCSLIPAFCTVMAFSLPDGGVQDVSDATSVGRLSFSSGLRLLCKSRFLMYRGLYYRSVPDAFVLASPKRRA